MDDFEATTAAQELAEHFAALADLNSHPASNATAIAYHRAEANALLTALGAHLLLA